MTHDDLGFVHRFLPAADTTSAPTLLLLHGTGGDEDDLLPLGRLLAAGREINLLSPRGGVSENGAPRFFRRLREGVFDEADVITRAGELARFVREAATRYGFDPARVTAVGYSNGANIAHATLLLHPEALRALVLFHAQPVLAEPPRARLDGKPVFLSGGRADPLVPASEIERLAELLRRRGADVTLSWQPGGHALTANEVSEASRWLAGVIAENDQVCG